MLRPYGHGKINHCMMAKIDSLTSPGGAPTYIVSVFLKNPETGTTYLIPDLRKDFSDLLAPKAYIRQLRREWKITK